MNDGTVTTREDRYKRELIHDLRSMGLTVSSLPQDPTLARYGIAADIRGVAVRRMAEAIEFTANGQNATIVRGLMCTIGAPLAETQQEQDDGQCRITFSFHVLRTS